MKNIYIVLIFLSSCATISGSNEPSISPNYEFVPIARENRKDVTFSVGYHVQMNEDIFIGRKDVIEKIRDNFRNSKLFGKVAMSTSDDDIGDLHYHFDIKVQGPSVADQVAIGYLSGMTLTLIPVWQSADVDATMFVFKNGKEIHSASVSTTGTDVIWAPLLVLSPLLNHGTVGHYNNRKIMNYFMNEIIIYELYK
jgi:hypothetical protein